MPPGPDVGTALAEAVWEHVKLQPMTKLCFNYSWVQLITNFKRLQISQETRFLYIT